MAGVRVVRLPSALPRRRDDAAARRHLRVVVPAGGRWGLRLSPRVGVLLTVLAFVALFGVAVCHALLIEGQARVDDLDQRVAAAQARYERLRLHVAELESPQRIAKEAQDELGMVPAGKTVWLTPDDPAPADAPADAPPEQTDTSAARVKPYLEAAP
jgi:cell division protein FtsL